MRVKKRGLLLFVLLLAVSLYFFLQSGFFSIRQVEVQGNSILSEEDVLKLAGVGQGVNIFKLNTEEIRNNVKFHPVVEEAEINRDLPAKVIIQVYERRPLALVPYGGEFVIIDRNGVFLRQVNSLVVAPNLPVATGLNAPEGWGPGGAISAPNLKGIVEVIESIDPALLPRISEINGANDQKYLLYTLDGVEIRLGPREALNQKQQVLSELLQQVPQGKKIQYIDVSFVDNPAIMYK